MLNGAKALGSGFTYQGRLEIEGVPAQGSYDFQFRRFEAATGGSQVGSTVTVVDVDVVEGFFSVLLGFGAAAFDGQARWLEIAVREGSSEDASPVIRHSALEGSTNSVYQEGTGTAKVANSQLMGPLANGLICFNNYDQELNAVVCP